MQNKYTKLILKDEIDSRIHKIAEQILEEYPEESPLFVALLRGAVPFASKLMFAISRLKPDYHPDLDYMLVTTYGDSHIAKEPRIITDLAPSTLVAGRDIVIIDDVIDQGITSEFVSSQLSLRGARSIKLAVFASKDIPSRGSQADFICLEAGNKWLVGLGLDDAYVGQEAYRWLEEIWEINH